MEETTRAHPAKDWDSEHVEVILPLTSDDGAAARTRRIIAQELRNGGLTEIADDAELVAAELMTNALLHAIPPFEVVLRMGASRARVEVHDGSLAPPVRPRPNTDAMTGRGLYLVEALTQRWGVTLADSGKAVWADFEVGAQTEAPDHGEDELLAMWTADEPDLESLEADVTAGQAVSADTDPEPEMSPGGPTTRSAGHTSGEPLYTVKLGNVPTELLLSAKAHVDNLMREFTLATAGARSGATAPVPAPIAELIDVVSTRFTAAREAIKRQAVAAAEAGDRHVSLELTLPPSAADAGEDYLRALDKADTYCRAARLLTLETPPQHRVFRRWYVEELIGQLRRAAAGEEPRPAQPFDQRLLEEVDRIASAERRADRMTRLQTLTVALAAAATPEAVANAVLREGVAALGATGGGMLLVTDSGSLVVKGAVGYDEYTLARLHHEVLNAQLPAAVAVRTRQPVWLESRSERDERFRDLAGMEPTTVSMCALPLIVGDHCLGALRFSFTEARVFDAEERTFIQAVAAQTAQALERAQLHERRRDITRRLQRSLLPRALPEIPGMQVYAAYQAGSAAMEVGGDFYDIWPCDDDAWAVAIGDVSGTGPEAAAVTALVRHTLRALTLSSTDIDAILQQLDRALADLSIGDRSERFSTVLFGILTTRDGVVLDLVSGGHVGPVVVRAGGAVEIMEMTGSMLGVLPHSTVDRRRIELGPGDEIVFVTDGATEARNGGRFFDIDGVAAVARAANNRGIDTAAAIERAVREHTSGELDDDLAVLALRRDRD